MEGDEMARQPIAGDRLTGVNRESAALQSAQFGEDKLGRLSSRQNGASLDKKQRAGSVNSMPRPTRWKSFAPWRPSSAAIEELTADCAMLSASAACVTCWRSATATKTRSCSSAMGVGYL